MASITYNPGINSSNPYVTMTVTESSYSVANNTSVVAWNLKLYRPSNISSSASKSYKIVVNGSTVKSGTTTIGGSGTKTIASGTSTISHNADGSKSISFSFSLTMDITWSGTKIGTASKSGSMSLTTIPRATTPTVSASSVDMGTSVTVNMPRASSSFTHTLQYTFAGTTTTIGSSLGTSKAWTIPLTLANSIPNATSGTLTFTCITYNGSTKIGSKTVSITAKVPSSVVPSASLSIAEAVAKVKNTFGVYVKGLSKLTVTTSGAGSYSSTIKSYKVTANGATYTSSSFTTGVLASSGSMTITATVTDSRGRTKSTSQTISVSDYASPTISGLSASRVDDGDNSNNNDNLSVAIKGNVTSLSGNNGTYKLEYKKSSATSYSSTSGSLSNYAVNTTVTLTGIDKDSSYDLKLTITDGYGNSTPKSISVPTEFTLVDYHSSGKGLAFGKVAEKANYIESALRMSFPCPSVTYLGGMNGDNASIKISTQQSADGFHPYVNIKSASSHVWTIGGINNYVGMYGFYNGRTANWYDWATYWDTTKGELVNDGTTWFKRATYHSDNQWFDTNAKCTVNVKNTAGSYVEAVNWCGTGNDLTLGAGNYRNNLGSTYLCGNVLYLLCKSSISANKSITVSSDRNLKKDFEYFSDKHDIFFDNLKPTIYKYILDSDNNYHFGYVAQEVEEALKKADLQDFAGVSVITFNERDTNIDDSAKNYLLDKGLNEQYTIAYDEFISLNTWQIQKLKAQVKEQQKEIDELKTLVSELISKVGGCM